MNLKSNVAKAIKKFARNGCAVRTGVQPAGAGDKPASVRVPWRQLHSLAT